MSEKKIDAKAGKATSKKDSKKKESKIKGFFASAKKFFRSCIGEIKKITWPTPLQTTKNFGIVLLVILIVGLFIFALDRGLYALLGLVMNVSAT